MSKKKSKGSKAVAKVLDLSQSDDVKQNSVEFEVQTYDYKDLQANDDPFEKDLDFLLQKKKNGIELRENIPVEVLEEKESIPQPKKNGGRKPRKMKVKVGDITKDIEDITFSSSDEEEESTSPTKNGRGRRKKNSAKKTSADEGSGEELDISIASKFVEGNLELKEDEIGKKKVNNKKHDDVVESEEGSDNNEKDAKPTKSLNKKKSRKQLNSKSSVADLKEEDLLMDLVKSPRKTPRKRRSKKTEQSPGTQDASPTKSTSKKSNKKTKLPPVESAEVDQEQEEAKPNSDVKVKIDKKIGTYIDDGAPIISQSDQTVLVGKNNEMVTVEELKKKKVIDQEYSIFDSELNLSRNQRKQLQNGQREQEPQRSSPSPERCQETPVRQSAGIDRLPESTPRKPSLTGMSSTPTRDIINGTLSGNNNSFNNTPEKNENPFAINLRSTKKTISNGKYSENLPEIRPTKTIIGLTHKQILNLSLSDVKIKAITSSTLTVKFVANILKFTLKHSHDIFDDFDIRSKFLKLCINVALYESPGFKKTCKEFDVEEYFGKYPEITLETTGTKLTPPAENIHQNQFDYSVLSFIGHVLIWAYYLQANAGVTPTLAEKYPGLDLDPGIVRKHLGGLHLWDRLRRSDSTVNTKRWKHINKFRESFGFYEDQFLLILRFLNVDDMIP